MSAPLLNSVVRKEEQMKGYDVHQSLVEDVSQGWVWIHDPDLNAELDAQRRIICIKSQPSGKSVYCEALVIGPADETYYNHVRRSRGHSDADLHTNPTILMNAWYRQKLGIAYGNNQLHVTISKVPLWHGIRACLHHPQVVVRLATWLGFLGVLLGILGVVFAIIPLFEKKP